MKIVPGLSPASSRLNVSSLKPFKINTLNGDVKFDYGSLVIPLSLQKISSDKLYEKLKKLQKRYNVDVHTVSSGLSSSGVDLGSGYVSPLTKPKAMILIGTGVRSYEAGEVWHLLDQRVGMPITKTTTPEMNAIIRHP